MLLLFLPGPLRELSCAFERDGAHPRRYAHALARRSAPQLRALILGREHVQGRLAAIRSSHRWAADPRLRLLGLNHAIILSIKTNASTCLRCFLFMYILCHVSIAL